MVSHGCIQALSSDLALSSSSDEAISAMTNCIADIRDWIVSDKLIFTCWVAPTVTHVQLDALMVGKSKGVSQKLRPKT